MSISGDEEDGMRDFRELKVWQKAHQLVLRVYPATSTFPASEAFGITAQMRKAAVSIPANIAEGCGRKGDPELARFMQIAMGSASELEYYVFLTRDLGLMPERAATEMEAHVVEVKRMLASFLQKLHTS
jgi:four helix bundle protein